MYFGKKLTSPLENISQRRGLSSAWRRISYLGSLHASRIVDSELRVRFIQILLNLSLFSQYFSCWISKMIKTINFSLKIEQNSWLKLINIFLLVWKVMRQVISIKTLQELILRHWHLSFWNVYYRLCKVKNLISKMKKLNSFWAN